MTTKPVTAASLNCIQLTHGAACAWIGPELGGNCVHLSIGEAELLRTPQSLEEWRAAPAVYGMPVLLPPNRIADGRFTWRGRSYTLPVNEPSRSNHLHGYLRDAAFTVAERKTTPQADSLTLRYHSACDPRYASQGLLFELELTYLLDEDGLHQQICLRNGGEPLPLGLGLHTTLRAPFLPGADPEALRLQVPALTEWTLERQRVLPTGEREATPLAQALRCGELTPCAQPLSNLFTVGGAPLLLTDRATGGRVVYQQEGYPFMMLWNQNASRTFVCCEPQSWVVDAPHVSLPQEETGFLPLEPGEERRYQTRLSYLP